MSPSDLLSMEMGLPPNGAAAARHEAHRPPAMPVPDGAGWSSPPARDTSHDSEVFAHYADGIEPGSAREVRGRIIELSSSGDRANIIINKGKRNGIREGAYGRVLGIKGSAYAAFTVGRVEETECFATTDASLEDLKGYDQVAIMAQRV